MAGVSLGSVPKTRPRSQARNHLFLGVPGKAIDTRYPRGTSSLRLSSRPHTILTFLFRADQTKTWGKQSFCYGEGCVSLL